MRRANFYCPVTKQEFFIPKFRTLISAQGHVTYIDLETKKPLQMNGVLLCFLEQKGDYTTNIGSCKAVDKKNMINHLKKRSHDHFKKDIAPVKSAMIAASAGQKG